MLESTPAARPSARPADRRFGLGVALVTPFAHDGSVDLARLVAHARNCLDEGCSTVTLFGTTGEGASLGSAAPHGHPLVLGTSSVHTDTAALERSLGRIREIGAGLRREGRV